MTIQKLGLFSLLLALIGCATPNTSSLKDLNYSLMTIQKGIGKAFPVNFRVVSIDGRNFTTYPFVRVGTKLVPSSVELERAFAYIEIRGVSRPYTVDVTVKIEEAMQPDSVQKNFKLTGYDDVVAKIFLARLKAYLLKSKKSSNVIDDFRIY